ncbi:MAG: 30S ribosomal protein S9 [Candidatus Colwellbacteria bacterium]|nr:30S ribosomal protein S9 [Candidatus Colwellbacteria bacterium]
MAAVKKTTKPEKEARAASRAPASGARKAKTKEAREETATTTAPFEGRYVEGVGRRKTSVARVRVYKGAQGFVVNGKQVQEYFKTERQRVDARRPLDKTELKSDVGVSVRVQGGGLTGQSEATAHGLARALVALEPTLRPTMRGFGFMTRDPRMVERKKYGLKKARRAPQWSKR